MRFYYYVPIFILALIVSGCEKNSPSPQIIYNDQKKEQQIKQINHDVRVKPYTIALVPRFEGDSYYKAAEAGAKEAADQLGVNLIFTGPPVADPDQQIKVIENLIEKKVDVIAVAATDPFKLLPVLNKARIQGIKVITWDSDTDSTGRDFFVNAVNPETLGTTLMDNLAMNLKEKGEFAIITNSYSASNTSEWIKWMKIEQEKYYPNIKLVRIMINNDSYQKSYEITKYLLKSYPNLSSIVSVSPEATPAAAEAVTEVGNSKVKVLGLSLPHEIRNYINDGVIINGTTWNPKELGFLTVSVAKSYINGSVPIDQQKVPNVGIIKVLDNVISMGPPIIFSKENLNQYDF